MTIFQTGDPVVYVGDDQALRSLGVTVGTVVTAGPSFTTICDDETGRVYQALTFELAYPEGTPLHHLRSGAIATALIPRVGSQLDSGVHRADFELFGRTAQGRADAINYAGARPTAIGKRVFPADAAVVHVGRDDAAGQFSGVGYVVRSHFDITTVRLEDGELRVIPTFDLSFPRGVRVNTAADPWRIHTLNPKRSAYTTAHFTHTYGGWLPTTDLIVRDTSRIEDPR
ncbi:hypothetical protein [Curtobacterium sp. MCBD17_040]|uniref:hypothetical protein n=1 Tax=Curtobacterium sp. MCBD17_040 TaxID=2175674 RepID=UPI000DA8231E|nr:hypothetical protein [Curtobacterium sp. MCBD17_040]WIB65481.1 hypothetical protein DEI94_19095 [Curtobacterium sp. MCBD17_040]